MTTTETFWSGKLVLVTGGASSISSTLTDHLLARGAKIRIVDDLISGHRDNIKEHAAGEKVNDGTAIDLGTMERIKVIDAARMVCDFTGRQAEIKTAAR